MATCTVRWRSSGGRGEFEFVPADSLVDRSIDVFFEPLGLTISSEVYGVKAQGKPRLRKLDKNDRGKFHLPQLVMAVARLPEPARQDLLHKVEFPLENKSFVMGAMDFDIIDDDGISITLAPLRISILHSNFQIDLQDRFNALAKDIASIDLIAVEHIMLSEAIKRHSDIIRLGVNTTKIRQAADEVISLQESIYGMTNAGSVVAIDRIAKQPATDIELDIAGIEGKLLTRIHVYRERDRTFALKAKNYYKSKNGGRLVCEACKLDPIEKYGPNGERCIEAHHKIPIEELQPDSITRIEDMAMVCASCHRIIHSKKPCLQIEMVLSAAADI